MEVWRTSLNGSPILTLFPWRPEGEIEMFHCKRTAYFIMLDFHFSKGIILYVCWSRFENFDKTHLLWGKSGSIWGLQIDWTSLKGQFRTKKLRHWILFESKVSVTRIKVILHDQLHSFECSICTPFQGDVNKEKVEEWEQQYMYSAPDVEQLGTNMLVQFKMIVTKSSGCHTLTTIKKDRCGQIPTRFGIYVV